MMLFPITPTEACELFNHFALVCGPEEMQKAYDYPATFRFPLPTEKHYEVQHEGAPAGWGSIVTSAYGTEAATRVGIFPAFRRHGLWKQAIQMLRARAFENPTIMSINSLVLLSNTEQAARVILMTQTEPWFEFDGLTLHPPAYHLITTRERWEAKVQADGRP